MLDRHLGNFLVASPVLAALAARRQSQLVVHGPHLALIQRMPALKCPVLTLGRGGGRLREFWNFAKLLQRVRAQKPAIAVDFGGSGSGGTVGAFSGAPRRICRDSAPYARRFNEHVRKPENTVHRIDIYGAIGRAVEPDLSWARPELAALPEDATRLQKVAKTQQIPVDRPWVCLHVAGGKSYKHWPLDRYAQLIDALYARGMQPLLIGAGPDRGAADQVSALAQTKPIDLVEKIDIGTLIGLFRNTALFIGNDSGPMHMAAASGTPIVALFGPTDPERWGPLTDQVVVVRGTEPIPPSEGKKTFPDGRRMDSIPVDAVLQAIDEAGERFRTRLPFDHSPGTQT
ncbi:glycosyltransferase family 9 protein [Methylonatrum kenyense]|uniref:glycosyltransferase family 9 protein n=1 Tax=Methylonatrum kenyense TaxID=455253 RepID=UPI0020BDC737|nr:glycosyltransferase family 9 protein [Methylonatrum kenyense]MCK8517001.1 glycosyltransferase family 9 protein [Methylonatrum kenyense]